MIGVGGIVVNDKQQILTINEKHAIIPGSWKLPGGYVEPSTFFTFSFRTTKSACDLTKLLLSFKISIFPHYLRSQMKI